MKQQNKNTTIAILPFQIQIDDERIKNLFFGFVDDLTTNLSKFIGLSVISYYSTQQIKDLSDEKAIEKLSADYLVFGNVRAFNDMIRISIQLVKADNKNLLFGAHHDKSLDALMDAQDSIIQQLVSVLQEKINFNLLSHSYKKPAVELATYENYLVGMNILKKGSIDNDIKARSYFQAALKIDPNYSLAYVGLSLSYFNFWSCFLWDRWDISKKGAHEYALKAIEIDPNDYTALGVLGRTYTYLEEYEKAEHFLRKSLRMNSNDASNLLRVSFSLLYLGYAKEAVKLYHKALSINPFHKKIYFAYGSNYYLEIGDYKESIALSKKVNFDCWTDFPAWVAAAYFQENDHDNLRKCWNIYLEQFKSSAYTGKNDLQEEAVNWLTIINPFKGASKLALLQQFIRNEYKLPLVAPLSKTIRETEDSFLLNGDHWELTFKGEKVLMKNSKGLHDIYKLISEPKVDLHCLDLMGSAIDESVQTDAVDSKTRAVYIHRIKELQQELDEAEALNNSAHAEKLREEYDAIVDHLSNALGLAGKTRKVGSTVEKARSAVTWRIRNSIKKIKDIHPELAIHLSKSIKTGTTCTYSPEVQINWVL